MSLFPAKLSGSAESPVADAGSFQAPLSGGSGRSTGREVIVGIRPEDIDAGVRPDQSNYIPVDAKVEVVEFLGNEFQLHLSAGGQTFVARVDTRTQPQPDATLKPGFDRSKIHVFDKTTAEPIA